MLAFAFSLLRRPRGDRHRIAGVSAERRHGSVPAAPSTAGTTVYDPNFFAPYSPRTALDVVLRVPGFQLEEGNSDIRGFAGAAGNVVFNGARPSSKADRSRPSWRESRRAGWCVSRWAPGRSMVAEYAGKSQVLNVILSAEGGFDGKVTASLRTLYTGAVIPMFGSATWKRGGTSLNLSAGTATSSIAEEGTDTLTDPDTGELIEFRRKLTAIATSIRSFPPWLGVRRSADNHSMRELVRPAVLTFTQKNQGDPPAWRSATTTCLSGFQTGFRAWRGHHTSARWRRHQAGRPC